MSYTPTTWENGDIITATKLNNIESGVQSVSNSYTPTTWVNGDIITATKLNNIEQGIANAGGGSSDFSTATVTVTNNSDPTFFSGSNIKNEKIESETNVGEGVNIITVVLYKSSAHVGMYDIDMSATTTTDGVTFDSGEDCYIVTGDGTITISS